MSWWDKQFVQTPQPQVPPLGRPSIDPAYLPRGMGAQPVRQAVDHYLQRQPGYVPPGGQPQVPQAPAGMISVMDAVNNFRGSRGLQQELANSCPNCGSDKFFSRSQAGSVTTQNGVVAPKPECFECGYPNEQGVGVGLPTSGVITATARQSGRPDEALVATWR